MTVDVLLLSVPRIAPVRPQAALGILKTLCNQAGKTSATFDINHDFFMRLANQSPAPAKIIDDYFVTFTDPLPVDTRSIYNDWLVYWVDRIVELDPDLLVISVFSWQSQRFTRDLLQLIRPRYHKEILIGGQGLVNSQNMSAHWSPQASYAQELYNAGLINWWLKGESEETFPRFLAGERSIPGLNNHDVVALADANKIPLSDFSDFDIDSYRNGYAGGVLPIESCRGCVRSCIFCEMSSEHGSYRSRDGALVAQEMIHYYETYGVQHYYFHDDLINGNLKDFNQFVDTLLAYYQEKNLPERHFSISGYWIIRSPRQFGEKDFEKFYRAGANLLITGIETGSDRLRKIIRKGFTNKDLEFNLEQITKWRMKFYFMLIAGLPGETIDDFNQTLAALTRWQKYVASGSIIGINLGTTATIEPGTEIYNRSEKYNLIGLNGERPNGIFWMNTKTPELDYKERVRRRVLLQEHVNQLRYPLWKGDDHLKIIIDKYKQNIEVWDH